MKSQLQQLFQEILKELGITDVTPDVVISEDAKHGEYTTNIAMRLSKSLKKSPMVIAQEIVQKIHKHSHPISPKSPLSPLLQAIDRVEVAPPGFINVFLSEAKLSSQITEVLKIGESYGTSRAEEGKKVMVEFAHPNTHKAFHIGHLRNITTGESIVRLLEASGYEVIRANYQGDVGMHIAKALYALVELTPYNEEVNHISGIKERVEFLGKAYAAGSKAFEEDEMAKERIKDYNYFVYAAAERFAAERGLPKPTTDYLSFVTGDKSLVETVYTLWKETRQWSLDYFDTIYARLGTHYDRFYFESECLTGVDLARQAVVSGVLEESEGAVIFPGKKHGIDTRVFVNSLGLPTYEAKELALSRMEISEFGKLSRIIHCVGPEQSSFFVVTFKAEELLSYVPQGVQYHLAYGWVNLKHGKMSSRTGNVILGEWLLDEAKKSIYEILSKNKSNYTEVEQEDIAEKGAIAAVKYAFLKVSTGQEIAFDLKESVSFDGDSGPYLLYTYARCKSVLRKASGQPSDNQGQALNSEEHQLARLITFFPEIVAAAAAELSPNVICTYLFQLAQTFNTFYQKHPILGEKHRLALTAATAQILKNGLYLLGISTVERM